MAVETAVQAVLRLVEQAAAVLAVILATVVKEQALQVTVLRLLLVLEAAEVVVSTQVVVALVCWVKALTE
jgi:hypothetical protein